MQYSNSLWMASHLSGYTFLATSIPAIDMGISTHLGCVPIKNYCSQFLFLIDAIFEELLKLFEIIMKNKNFTIDQI